MHGVWYSNCRFSVMMVRIFSFLIVSFLCFNLSAQVTFNKSTHNFGEINANNKKYYDFTLSNASNKSIKITKHEEPYGVDVIFSNKEIKPDSTVVVRIKYTPKRKGSFKKDIPVWVSSNTKPIVFTVKGNAKTFDVNEPLNCPPFIQNNKQESFSLLNIKVVDINTKQAIKNAKIEVIWDGLIYKQLFSDLTGVVKQNLKWDNYYIVVNAEGYASKEQAIEITGNKNEMLFELGVLSEKEKLAQKDTVLVEDTIEIEQTDTISTKELPTYLYAPNNVVFLLDVSVSMKQQGRLDLLKAAMIELLNSLRTIDKLAIVTYASDVNIVLNSAYVTNKTTIIELIKGLEAGGSTAGSKGVKKAYQVAKDSFIENGNNQVIISTDGAFNLSKGDRGIINTVESYSKKGINISVVGVKNERWTVKSMKKIAELGNGNYLHIENYSQAKQVLLNEIKSKSRKQ